MFYPVYLKSVYYKDNKPFEGLIYWQGSKEKKEVELISSVGNTSRRIIISVISFIGIIKLLIGTVHKLAVWSRLKEKWLGKNNY